MSTDNKRAPHDLEDEDLDGESHAADEPTAVWDESALRAAGLTDLLHRRDSEPPPRPATLPPPAPSGPSIVIEDALTATPPFPPSPEPPLAAAPASSPRGLGWGATVAIAVALGALVYLLVRLIKG